MSCICDLLGEPDDRRLKGMRYRLIADEVVSLLCPEHGFRCVPGELPEIHIEREPRSLHDYQLMLERRSPFSLSRWNDGEWMALFGYPLKNANGSTVTPALSWDLLRVLKRNYPYDHALLRLAIQKYGVNILDFMDEHQLQVKWVEGDLILDGMLEGKLYPLIRLIREYRVLYVGNTHLRNLQSGGFFPLVDFIEPAPRDCHAQCDRIVRSVVASVAKNRIDFVGWSAGMASKVFIDRVYAATYGEVTQIDFGSSLDGYFGLRTRRYMGDRDWDLLWRQNTKGE